MEKPPDARQLIASSRFLSLVLRHQPEIIGLKLDPQGWAKVDDLLECLQKAQKTMSLELLKYLVETNPKKRFAFDESFSRIRANQGHSLEIDLGYEPQKPPSLLFHGTAVQNWPFIEQEGLRKMSRQHVHLSLDMPTAIKVGQRHGKVIVLEVLAGEMWEAGFAFFLSENQVWLTEFVPSKYIRLHPSYEVK
ncbi:MAG: RNA 2'-phosphotransferase [Cytophagales bacterium]|nr:MAG: RNA 2'-phosphotransferase [Cytophagales bacterium]TAF59749.1 MAG: RNA 2'-phosphotransferase [Cytophagales bacterium]